MLVFCQPTSYRVSRYGSTFLLSHLILQLTPKYWQIFGENYLVFPEREYSCAKVFDIRNAQFFTTAPRDLYKKIYDNIYYNNFIYALGRGYERKGKYHDKLFLYRNPWDKAFKTNITDFVQPLF